MTSPKCFGLEKAPGGFGLAVVAVLIVSIFVIIVGMQLTSGPTTNTHVGKSSRENLAAREATLVGLSELTTDLQDKLSNDIAINAGYIKTGTVSAYKNPAITAAGTDAVGTYTATVTEIRGSTYTVRIAANVGGSTVTVTKLLQLAKTTATTPPSYDCSTVTNQILAGQVSTVANADLILWAQNDCMITSAGAPSAGVTTTEPTVNNGPTAPCNTHSGSGTLRLAQASTEDCDVKIDGSYTDVIFNSPTSASAQYVFVFSNTSGASRNIHIPGSWHGGSDICTGSADVDGNCVTSSKPHNFYFNATATTWSYLIYGGNGNDLFSFDGNSNADIKTKGGNNTIIIDGTWGRADTHPDTGEGGNTLYLGEGAGSSNTNDVYIKTMAPLIAHGTLIETLGGKSNIYTQNIGTGANGGDISIWGGAYNDIIYCGLLKIDGVGSGTCAIAPTSDWYEIHSNGGNDIISLDASVGANMEIQGNAGHNIVYIKGCTAGATVSAGSGTSVVIVDGNIGCTITGGGGNSVLLKSGSGSGASFSKTLSF